MEREQAKRIIEALLYMTDHPLAVKEIQSVLDTKDVKEADVLDLMNELKSSSEAAGSALALVEVAGGYQMATRPEVAPWVRRLYKERLTVRLSPSAMETLSIIAYKQPIARAEIEHIRGVEVAGVMDTLLERRLIKVVGRKETIGRPLLYGTTTEFLRQFGLRHLADLPDLSTISPAELTDHPADQQPAASEEKELVPASAETPEEPA